MPKGGRGLERALPDLIPLERVDILADLKQLVDVHRITDFTVADRIQPTIELRRIDDELIVVFSQFVAALAGNFSIVQLWNDTQTANLRPIAATFNQNPPFQIYQTVVAIGAPNIAVATDRRRAALALTAALVGSYRPVQQVAAVGGQLIWTQNAGDVSPDFLRTLVLPPGTGLNLTPGIVNLSVFASVAYKVEPINTTRPLGV